MKSIIPSLGLVTIVVLLAVNGTPAQDQPPEQAIKRMTIADGFEVKLVASEPLVRQPNTMSFDDRGRLWVIQYLQYPTPAGLKAVHVDKYLRTTYDRVPKPPPHGPRGKDKITILFDPDANGCFQKSKDFVTGLNLASGMALGHGGVFVAQPPYLLFYPDKNGDDVPDGDPEVLLKGFGMEDAHAFANSLQWGPDGWLYGAHGSTSYANIRGISFVQGIWRYHPITKEFELFSEGGGNTYGLDFDRQGNAIASTNFGGRANLHQVQGAYYVKNFVKHGALKNPHAYGYFGHIPYKGFQGAHVTCGGIVYQDDAFPRRFKDMFIGANPLSNFVAWHKMAKNGSTYKAEHGGYLIKSSDRWFRPIDCEIGPWGEVYIADWYDKRITHHDPRDNWDRRNGRIYKLQPKGFRSIPVGDLSKMTTREIVHLLKHKNVWFRRQARRILAERRDKSAVPLLQKWVTGKDEQLALESLWALHVTGGLTDKLAERLLVGGSEQVITWTVRLLGDRRKVTARQKDNLIVMAHCSRSPLVRSQLACTARRLPAKDAFSIVRGMLRVDDRKDPFIPLLIWWAIEEHAVSARPGVRKLFDEQNVGANLMSEQFILDRLGRRYMAEGNAADYEMCAWLLKHAHNDACRNKLLSGMEKALSGKPLVKVPPPLQKTIAGLLAKKPNDLLTLRLAARLGSNTAVKRAQQKAAAAKSESVRVACLELLGSLGQKEFLPLLLNAYQQSKSARMKTAALAAMQSFRDERVTDAVLASYPKLSGSLRTRARSMLVSREKSALHLLSSIDQKKIAKADLSLDQVRQIYQFKNTDIKKLIEKHWGKMAPASADDKKGRLRHYRRIFSRGQGDLARGRIQFKKLCATCHTLFKEGNKIGPDLTTADRKNRELLLFHIVDPSAVQRMEYANYLVVTKDGRSLTGVIKNANAETVTLVNAKNEKTEVPKSTIDELLPSQSSLMPEKILEPLSDQEFLDLFAYLQTERAPVVDEVHRKKRP